MVPLFTLNSFVWFKGGWDIQDFSLKIYYFQLWYLFKVVCGIIIIIKHFLSEKNDNIIDWLINWSIDWLINLFIYLFIYLFIDCRDLDPNFVFVHVLPSSLELQALGKNSLSEYLKKKNWSNWSNWSTRSHSLKYQKCTTTVEKI